MTGIMKIEAVTYLTFKILGYISGIVGAVGILEMVGRLEYNIVTIPEYLLGELLCFGLIALAFGLYYVRELIRKDFIRREHRRIKGIK
jgi:hypothetical protein